MYGGAYTNSASYLVICRNDDLQNFLRTDLSIQSELLDLFQTSSGSTEASVSIQAGKMVKFFDEETRSSILKEANISSVDICPETMIAMKVDMGIPWEKLKTMSRYKNLNK